MSDKSDDEIQVNANEQKSKGKTLFHYDMKKSLRFSPVPLIKFNRKHKVRLIIDAKLIFTMDDKGVSYQPRELINLPEEQAKLKVSLSRRGWLHDHEPLYVVPHPAKKGFYKLVGGFNRYHVMTVDLGWTHVIVDVWESAISKEDELKFPVMINNDNTSSAPNKDIDYIKVAVKAVETKCITPVNEKDRGSGKDYEYTDDDIANFLMEVVKTTDGAMLRTEREIIKKSKKGVLLGGCLVYKVRRVVGYDASLLCLDGVSVYTELQKLGKGWKGEKGYETTGELVYAFPPTNDGVLRTTFWKGVQLYKEYNKPIDVYGYIEQPISSTLKSDRERIKNKYEDWMKICEEIVETCNSSITDHINVRDIFRLKGFLPQDKSPDPSRNGEPTEVDIIEV